MSRVQVTNLFLSGGFAREIKRTGIVLEDLEIRVRLEESVWKQLSDINKGNIK